MNALDILKYSHIALETELTDLPENEWLSPGVCGYWAVKDIVAHLASFEQLLVDVLTSLPKDQPSTPVLDRYLADEEGFNDDEVTRRQHLSAQEVWDEYKTAYNAAISLLDKIPLEGRRLTGALAWYGNAYDLEDFLVYTYHGHKREHSAQIAVFKDQLHTEQITVAV